MVNMPPIHYLSSPETYREKERCYLDVRQREGRIWADEDLKSLPKVSKSSAYAREWQWRERTLARFQAYVQQKLGHSGHPARLLDLGCGNGWMAHRLAENLAFEVWAVDLNETELAQGARCFGRPNLHFAYADLFSVPSDTLGPFDIIVLAASVQYFPDLGALLHTLRQGLGIGGEIHVLDSPFYPNEAQRLAAQQRTLDYYTRLGVSAMAGFYHHHTWPEAAKLGAKNLNNYLKIKCLQKIKWLAPFPWLRFER